MKRILTLGFAGFLATGLAMSPVSVFAQPNAGTDTKAPATAPVAGHDAKSTGAGDAKSTGAGDAKSTDAGKDAVKGKTGTTDAAKAGTAKSSSAKAGTTPATTGTPAKTGG